jgi:hypothetical protein
MEHPMTLHFDIDWLTVPLNGIGLDTLNQRAAMMSRIDNKYVVPAERLQSIVPDLAARFDILEIDRRRAFTYATRYYDDADRSAYYEHHKGIRKGFKVRVRRYLEAGLCYLEVKVKGQRGMTEKYRMPYDPAALGWLTPEAATFAADTYEGQYGKPFGYALEPSLDVQYRRITLVAKDGGERMTIDTDLRFASGESRRNTGQRVFIVETKSTNGRGLADKMLRRVHERPTRKCSKYCIGMAALGQVSRWNRFLPAMRKLGLSVTGPRSEAGTDHCRNLVGPRSLPRRIAS